MNELMTKIAELLDVTVDSAVELYPIIKGQYIWYSLFEKIGDFNFAIGTVVFIALTIGCAWYLIEYEYADEEKLALAKRFIKIPAIALGVVTFIWFALVVANHLLAPDIILIKGLLN